MKIHSNLSSTVMAPDEGPIFFGYFNSNQRSVTEKKEKSFKQINICTPWLNNNWNRNML